MWGSYFSILQISKKLLSRYYCLLSNRRAIRIDTDVMDVDYVWGLVLGGVLADILRTPVSLCKNSIHIWPNTKRLMNRNYDDIVLIYS